MPVQIVMDYGGDTRHYFEANNSEAVAKAEARFKKLTGKGYTAAACIAAGEVTRVSSFNPASEETVFFPRLIGG